MSIRNSHAAKDDRRETRETSKKKVSEKKVFFPLLRKNRNRYAFVDGVVVDLLADADLTPKRAKSPRHIYGPKSTPG